MTDGLGRGRYALVLVAVLAVQAVLLLLPGGLYINGHEGDLLHTMEAASRIADGEWPHLDFMTPLGLFAFGPIALMMRAGFTPGMALLASYIFVSAVLLPGIWHVGSSRLGPKLRVVFGIWMLVFISALVFGGDQATLSVSMFYNRWGWALTTLVVLTILLPPKTAVGRSDGALIGLCMAALLLLKFTYFISLAPAVLAFFVVQRAGRAFIAALLAAGFVGVLVTLLVGDFWFWGRYLGDLLFVAGSETRPKPGLDFAGIVANPANLPATIALMAAIVVLRLGGHAKAGLLLLFLAPGFFYITFQNWGNDPQWLVMLAFVLVSLCPAAGSAAIRGYDARPMVLTLVIVVVTVAAPSVINITFSTLRGAFLDRSGYLAAIPGPDFPDIFIERKRNFEPIGQIDLPPIEVPELPGGEAEDAEDPPVRVAGEVLAKCEAFSALVGTLRQIGAEITDMPEMDGASVLTADILNGLWMFAPVKRLAGAAPWYYGGRPGFASVEYLLVPLCPVSPKARQVVLSVVEEDGWQLELVRRTPHYLLFRRTT